MKLISYFYILLYCLNTKHFSQQGTKPFDLLFVQKEELSYEKTVKCQLLPLHPFSKDKTVEGYYPGLLQVLQLYRLCLEDLVSVSFLVVFNCLQLAIVFNIYNQTITQF